MSMIPDRPGRATPPALLLAMLLLVYTFNFVDRQILAILAGPIKAEFALSDKQLGLLGGLAFALLYSVLGVPLGWLADRTGRARVVAGSLALWSACTALCGLAGGFGSLFLARVGVGVGEAGGVAPSHALIMERFAPERRARALAIYSLGIPFGSALGVLLGGYVAAAVDWRAAFLVVGIAGLLFAPVFALIVREPPRPVAAMPRAGPGAVFRLLAGKPAFWLLAAGAATCSMMGYGLSFWMPSLLRRSFGLDLAATARFFGLLLLLGGSAGILAGGWLADRLGARDRAAYAYVPAFAFAAAVPLYAAGLYAGSTGLAFALFLLPQALAWAWLAPVLTAVQHLVPPPMRATASASLLLIVNLVGIGLGTTAIGAVSDALTPAYGEGALRVALLVSLLLYLVAALLMALAGPSLRRDWVGDRA